MSARRRVGARLPAALLMLAALLLAGRELTIPVPSWQMLWCAIVVGYCCGWFLIRQARADRLRGRR